MKNDNKMIIVLKAQTDGEDVINYNIYDEVGASPESTAKVKSAENTLFLGNYKDFHRMIQIFLVDELNKRQIKIQDMLELVNNLY